MAQNATLLLPDNENRKKLFPLSLLPPSLERGREGRMKMGETIAVFSPPEKKEKKKKPNPLGSWRGGGICMLLLFSGATYFSIFALPNPSFPVRMFARAGRHMVVGGGGGRLFSLFFLGKTLSGI